MVGVASGVMVRGIPDELVVGQLRDWNEELQTARELPVDSSHLKIYRDKLIFKVSPGVELSGIQRFCQELSSEPVSVCLSVDPYRLCSGCDARSGCRCRWLHPCPEPWR